MRAQVAGDFGPLLARRTIGGSGINDYERQRHEVRTTRGSGWVDLNLSVNRPLRQAVLTIFFPEFLNLAHHKFTNLFIGSHMILLPDKL